MKLRMHLFEMRIGHMCVDLRRGEIFVAEEFLHRTKVRAITQ